MLIMKSNKVTQIIFTALILFVFEKAQGKLENITTYLNNYEVSKITELKLPSGIEFDSIENRKRSIEVKAFGKIFDMDLAVYFPKTDIEITYFSNFSNETSSFLDLQTQLYQGQVRNVKDSFVIGSFPKKNLFRGYIITDEVYCVEPNYKRKTVMVYKLSDVKYPGCTKAAEGKVSDCTKTKYFMPWKANPLKKNLKYVPYSWPYDKYFNNSFNVSETRSQDLGKQELDVIEKIKSFEEKRNAEGSDDNNKKRNGTATNHPHDHKQENGTDTSHPHHHHGKHKKKNDIDTKFNKTNGTKDDDKQENGTDTSHPHHHHGKHKKKNDIDTKFNKTNGTKDDDDEDDVVDDNDEDDKDNEINVGKNDFSTGHASRMKKDSYSKSSVVVNELEHSLFQNETNDNNSLYEDVQAEIDLHIYEVADKNEKKDLVKSPPSLLKSNESLDFIGITSESSIANLTENVDSFMKNSSFVESLDMRNDSLYAANSKLRNEQVRNKDERSVKSPSRKKLKKEPLHFECNVQFVFDETMLQKFEGQPKDVIKDILIQTTLLNKILGKVVLRWKNQPFHLHLEVQEVVIYGKNIESPFNLGADLEYFNERHERMRNFCFIIGLVNENLKSGEFSHGYIPNAGGGACSKYGNIMIVSQGDPKTPLPMALYFSALMRGITRGIGANDEDKTCTEGNLPNPMKMLQDYLLAKVITPGKKYSIFTECNVNEIEIALNNTECLISTNEPWCGNGVIDKGEECDCGPDYICHILDPCCTPHHRWAGQSRNKRGCKLVKGAKCSSSQPCCNLNCNVTAEKRVCHESSDPCDVNKCDGKSAECLTFAYLSDNKVCKHLQPEPQVCKNRKCGQGLCTGSKLTPCTCSPETEKECVYCCMKDGKCKAAGSELNLLKGNKDYPVVDGTSCEGGKCSKGNCSGHVRKKQKIDIREPPRFPATVDGAIITTSYSIPYWIFFLATLHFLRRCFV